MVAAWWPRLRTPALLVAAALLSGFTLLREIGPHDEGLMLQAAQRIADGEWPYRDFWWNYGPGQPLLLAIPVELFGPSLLWWRIVRVALDAIVALLAYRLARRGGAPEWLALGAWLATAGAMAWPATPGPNPAALALVLGAVLLARRRPWLAGAMCGIAVAFRPEIGAAGAIAVALVGGGWRSLGIAAGAAVACLAPFFAVAPGDMLDDTVGFLGVQDMQRLPLDLTPGTSDPNKALEALFPAILVAATAVWAAWAVVRRPRWALPALPLLAVGMLYLLGRPDEFHLVPLAVVLAIALAVAAAGELVTAARAALVVALALIALHGVERRAGQLLRPPELAAVPSPVADGVTTTPADAAALGELLPRIAALVPPGRPIFVAPPRFDRVSVGDPLLYVLAQRPNPTRYDVIQPGIATTAEVQREMIADLERARPEVLVRWLDPRATRSEPNASARSSGVRLLDRYLAERYEPVARFGPYRLERRAGEPRR
ncbi:MAG TPA: glycosyltransferase 87 family protein [Capillimicrobium sp.]|nr:glycosyltransferase 87 family protein [Capillimicrobium sp.]